MLLKERTSLDAFESCRYCSLVSQVTGEDPIGTAIAADHWLIIEVPYPWKSSIYTEDPHIAAVMAQCNQLILWQGVKLRPLMIAPDPHYSHPDQARILYYQRSEKQFAKFHKQEYLVPKTKSGALAIAILDSIGGQQGVLSQYQQYLQPTGHIRDILICTHGNIDIACSKFGYPLYKKLRSQTGENPSRKDNELTHLRVWQCSHFGGHRFAPTLIDLPTGQYWGHMTMEKMELLLRQEGEVEELRQNYRGWSGLGKFEQIAERELWQRYGWDWFTYRRSGKLLKKGGLTGLQRFVCAIARWIPLQPLQFLLEMWTSNAKWAEVEIRYFLPHDTQPKIYRARIQEKDTVMTAPKSSKNKETMQLKPLPQYAVAPISRPST